MPKETEKKSSNIFNFAGNLFNLASGNKGDKNSVPVQKMKKVISCMND